MGDACWKVFANDLRIRFQEHAFAHVTGEGEKGNY